MDGELVSLSNNFLVLTALPLLISCAPPQTLSNSEQRFSAKPPIGCEDSAIQGKYIIHHRDGRISSKFADEFEMRRLVASDSGADWQTIEPDYRVKLPQGEISTLAAYPASSDNWGQVRIGADAAWSMGIFGEGITVAVIDTGIDPNHPQLQPRLSVNSGETGKDSLGQDRASNGVDDDQNGFVDDVNGYDFTTQSGNLVDHAGHGTHVAGIIAADHSAKKAGTSSYVLGIAPRAKILPLAFIDSSGGGSMSDAIKAIDYAMNNGAQVINASWGGSGCSKILRDKVAELEQRGVLFVAAAGNSGSNIDYVPEFPAAFNLPGQITVGATGYMDLMTEFSNYGDITVQIFAPGSDIVSTYPGGKMVAMSGTSMATPFVSGVAALVRSLDTKAAPGVVREAILRSVVQRNGYRNASRGRLDVGQLIHSLFP